MATIKTNAKEETGIRAVIDDWASAIRAKNAGGVVSCYAANAVKFTLAPPLQYSRDNPFDEKELQAWFASFQGPLGYEIRDLSITIGDDVAFCHSLNRMTATTINRQAVDLWFRETLGLCRIAGKWKIMHEHSSVPFYMDGSFKAAVDLKP